VQTEELFGRIAHQAVVFALFCVSYLKWRQPKCHCVQQNAQAENISFLAAIIVSFRDDFGSHVGRRAANTTQWHQQALGETEIAQSDRVVLRDQNVLKFDVCMAHLGHMGCLNSFEDLREEAHHELWLLHQVTTV